MLFFSNGKVQVAEDVAVIGIRGRYCLQTPNTLGIISRVALVL